MMNENKIEQNVKELEQKLATMGLDAVKAIRKAMDSLLAKDKDLAKEVIEGDEKIDQLDKEIESFALRMLLLDNPFSKDFLRISAALKMITDIERIGDYAVDIAIEVVDFPEEAYIRDLSMLLEMGDAAVAIVHKAVKSFVNGDLAMAKELEKDDDKIDLYFHRIKDKLVLSIKEKEANADQAVILMMIAKYLERIGDHAVNIGEWVDYLETGTHVSNY